MGGEEWRRPWAALLFRILAEKGQEGGTQISRINIKEKNCFLGGRG